MKNVVIKVLNPEHGQKVKKYFQSLNLPDSVKKLSRLQNFQFLELGGYYGVKDNEFGCWGEVRGLNVITLPEHPEKWWVRFTGDDVKDQIITDWFNQGIGKNAYSLRDRGGVNIGLVYPNKSSDSGFSAYAHMMDNNHLLKRYTEISYDKFLEIIGQSVSSTPDMLTKDSITDVKTTSQPQKPMNAIKTKTIKINGLDREVTVAVLINTGTKIKAGYSVKNPEDKTNQELANMIALGRADKEKTSIDTGMYITESMRKKFILYAVIDNIFNQIEKGSIAIKGVK